MSNDLTEIREQAQAHERELEARASFYTVKQLAERWGCVPESVRAIPFDRLPWTAIGNGRHRVHRRYAPAAVERYERSRGEDQTTSNDQRGAA